MRLQRAGLMIGSAVVASALFAVAAPENSDSWRCAASAPILSPQGNGWESAGTFNPTVVMHDGKYVMLYRAQDAAGTSRLGYAESKNGIHFTRRVKPVFSPETDYEKDGGVEDPRLVKIAGTYYLTYTGYNKRTRNFAWLRRRI